MRELSYIQPDDPPLKRWLISVAEDLAGRKKYLPLYAQWKLMCEQNPESMMTDMLKLIDVNLDINAPNGWPSEIPKDEPLIMIANHPFGIADGIISLVLAEQLKRPYRVLINKDLLNVPQIKDKALPIDFAPTKEALENNLKSRAQARALLKDGVTIVVFPSGGVATAPNPWGEAEELPWGTFPARLVQQAKASVLPIYFDGQAGPMFHLASRVSQSLRMMLMVIGFRNFPGSTFKAKIGDVARFEHLPTNGDRQALTDELYLLVQRLRPGAKNLTDDDLRPTPLDKRPNYPWDEAGFY